MSFLYIIPQVWADGTHMLVSSIKQALGPTSLRKSNTNETIILTAEFVDFVPPTPKTVSAFWDRSRPTWMTRGITPLNEYENHSEPFPAYDAMDPLDEYHAMCAAHVYTDLVPTPRPIFLPDLTPLDTQSAIRVPQDTHGDIFFHEAEAALEKALRLAHSDTRSPYMSTHPAFTTPQTTSDSPITRVIAEYIEDTHARCPNGIRVASPFQMSRELETCLLLAFGPYMTSKAFLDAQGKNTVVPEMVTEFLEEGGGIGRAYLTRLRDAMQCCKELRVKGSEGMLEMWDAWKWVAKCYVGVLVLRHEARKEEQVVWE